jgi:hypothetical protein
MNVKQVDYKGLVQEMALAGTNGDRMSEILAKRIGELGPFTNEEAYYFWSALFREAAKSNRRVWLFLLSQPEVRALEPPALLRP